MRNSYNQTPYNDNNNNDDNQALLSMITFLHVTMKYTCYKIQTPHQQLELDSWLGICRYETDLYQRDERAKVLKKKGCGHDRNHTGLSDTWELA